MSLVARILGILVIMLAPAAYAADTPAPFTDTQKAAIEEVVRDLLIKKEPEIIIKAAQKVQEKQEAESVEKSIKAVATNKEKIFNDASSPVGGNPKGDVTIVEFYDYQCGYCKMMQEPIKKLLGEDKNIKFVYKEFPVLGEVSTLAAKASLAGVRQNKFIKFHEALMDLKERLSEDVILKTAKSAGLDADKLKKDMTSDEIDKQIKANLELGTSLGARGTPSFVIGDQLYPGALPFEAMKKAVEEARKKAKK